MTRQPGSPARRRRTPRPFPVVECDDPALYRHARAADALRAMLPLLVRAVRQQQESEAGAESGSGLSLQGAIEADAG